MNKFDSLVYSSPDELRYGVCKNPLTLKNGMVLGGGHVIPELNFTIPNMKMNKDTLAEVVDIYKEIVTGALDRAIALHQPEMCFEFEHMPEHTINPEWGIEIHKAMRDIMFTYEANKGIKSAMRNTPGDLREFTRPMILRQGKEWDALMKSIAGSCKDGADYISCESCAGKEIHDIGLMNSDLKTVIFAIGCMAARDMEHFWMSVNKVCAENGAFGAGDSGCGFGNTAMVLAETGLMSRVVGALARIGCAPRSMIPYEQGSKGPNKDCSFEGVFMKSIAGFPIATEGKAASCAHFDQVGNIMMYATDLWSNESVQQLKLLSGFTTVMSTEQLIYDVRMLNKAEELGYQKQMREVVIKSDMYLDPHAYVLSPGVVYEVAKEIIKGKNKFQQTLFGIRKGLELFKAANASGELKLSKREMKWVGIAEQQLSEIPDDEEKFIAEMKPTINPDECNLAEYKL